MMPYEPVLDVMRRTMSNLEFVQRHATEGGPFEVTQLINSFLGALAHPWENMSGELKRIEVRQAEKYGWPSLHKERSTDRDPSSLGDLIRRLRNGVAHGNLTFLPDGRGQISALRIVNKDQKGHRTWGTILSIADMRCFLDHFVDLVEAIARGDRNATSQVA